MKPAELANTCTDEEQASWAKFITILRYLRSEHGCPWDKEQSIASLKPHIIEEATELIEAIALYQEDASIPRKEHVKEELGDVFLVVSMMMLIFEQDEGEAQLLESTIQSVNEKLIRRHPHVFKNIVVKDKHGLASQWNKIKTEVEQKTKPALGDYKNFMHVLERTKEIQKRLSKEKGKFNNSLSQKIALMATQVESLTEYEADIEALKDSYSPSPDYVEKALGEVLFSLVDLARSMQVSPTAALSRRLASEISQHE